MSELNALTAQRDELLTKIREIEENCEGIENENNARRIQQLNLEQAKLNAQKDEAQAKLNAVKEKLSSINAEIAKLSGTAIDRILEAIKKQRWYFLKNKTEILMDRNTGLLWANLDYFPYKKNNGNDYKWTEAENVVNSFNGGYISNWVIPKFDDFKEMIYDRSFPFQEGNYYYIKNAEFWHCDITGYKRSQIDLDDFSMDDDELGYVIPCNNYLVNGSDYKNNISPNNHVYTEKERLQFTLDLFVQNKLLPIFDDDEITQLYKNIYFEKPALLEQLQKLQSQIEALQTVTLLSSDFDYTVLLSKYDIKSIDQSIIKYYQAVQQWTDELMAKLDNYEQEMESVIRDFNLISLKLSKKYENNPHLTDEENTLLAERQRYF